MRINGMRTQMQAVGDGAARQTVANQAKDLQLSRCQPIYRLLRFVSACERLRGKALRQLRADVPLASQYGANCADERVVRGLLIDVSHRSGTQYALAIKRFLKA